MTYDDEIEQTVCTVVRKYARRSGYRMDMSDAMQEGRAAAIAALRTYLPGVGVPLNAYVMRAVTFAIKRYLWTTDTQVSGGLHRPEVQRAGLRSRCASIDAIDANGDPYITLRHSDTADRLMAERDRALRARQCVESVARAKGISAEAIEVAIGACAHEMSTRSGRSPHSIRREASRLRDALACSTQALTYIREYL